jgi:hypothetical protein
LDLKIPNGFSLTVPNIEHFTFHQIDSNFFLFTFSLGETEMLQLSPNEIFYELKKIQLPVLIDHLNYYEDGIE